MHRSPSRTLLVWLGALVGLSAAAVTATWVHLAARWGVPDEQRMLAAGLALLSLIMAFRCGRHALRGARARAASAPARCLACGSTRRAATAPCEACGSPI
jgi:hypothetical protein